MRVEREVAPPSAPRKASVVAPANIAFVKYWGAHDLETVRPMNPSISMTLARSVTHTTVEVLESDGPPGGPSDRSSDEADELWLVTDAGELQASEGVFRRRALAHARRVCRELGSRASLRIATRNSFPTGAGIASSASGFTALTLAVRAALGESIEADADLSRQVRRSGSGSAARSVFGGFVEWPSDPADSDPAAVQIAPADHWPLCDVIAVVASDEKSVSSREGHVRAPSSPHFARRLELLDGRLKYARHAIADRRLDLLGPELEKEAIELHLIAMSSDPPIYYWLPATLDVLEGARALRDRGVPVWATIDAGPNVHLICEPDDEATVATTIAEISGVESVLRDTIGGGPQLSEEHLF